MWPFVRKPKPVWSYVATIEGRTHWTDSDGEVTSKTYGQWVLSESDQGARKADLIGDPGSSQLAVKKEAEIKAWLLNGPLPTETDPYVPEPKKPKKTAELFVFEGGKKKEPVD